MIYCNKRSWLENAICILCANCIGLCNDLVKLVTAELIKIENFLNSIMYNYKAFANQQTGYSKVVKITEYNIAVLSKIQYKQQ